MIWAAGLGVLVAFFVGWVAYFGEILK